MSLDPFSDTPGGDTWPAHAGDDADHAGEAATLDHPEQGSPHVERELWLLLTGARQPNADEQSALASHLYSCFHCQLTLRAYLRRAAAQEEDESHLYASALTLLDKLSRIISKSASYARFLDYSHTLAARGEKVAAARFPAIDRHVRTCPTCSAALEENLRNVDPRLRERGRRPNVKTAQAAFVDGWMREKRLRVTRAQMAEFAGVSPAFITRYFNSKDPRAFPADSSVHEAVCECLSFDDAARREYLAIWGITVEQRLVARALSYHWVDLEQSEEYIDQLGALVVERSVEQLNLLIRGLQEGKKPESLISALHNIYQALRDLPGDVRVAEAQLRVGLFLATLQELALPTTAAARAALATYDDLLHHVFPLLAGAGHADEYFQVLMRRIVLRRIGRAGPRAYASEADLGLPEQADAIRRLLPRVQDPSVIASYYCQRLHTHAVAGNDEAWMDELRAVEQLVKGLRVSGALGDELDAILEYTTRAGRARLAGAEPAALAEHPQHAAFPHVSMVDLLRPADWTPTTTPDSAPSGFEQAAYDANLSFVGFPRAFAGADLQQVVSLLDAQFWHDLLNGLGSPRGTEAGKEPRDDPESA